MRKLAVLLAAGLVAIGVAGPAEATTTIDVTFEVDIQGVVPVADCVVTVDSGSDGFDVLDQAVDDECIDGYETTSFDFGDAVTCINDICAAPSDCVASECVLPNVSGTWGLVTFWELFVDGDSSLVGAGDLDLTADTDLRFEYTSPWLFVI